MTNEVFFSFMTSLLICMALIPPLRLIAEHFDIVDTPGGRRQHPAPIPRIGGIAFAVGAFAAIAWWAPRNHTTLTVLGCGSIILVFGVLDDLFNLHYRIKLLGQVLAALFVVVIGDIHFDTMPFMLDTEMPLWISIPASVLFLVGVSNAVNLTDGLDGLAGGLSFLTLTGIAYLSYLAGDSTILLLTVPFLGGLLGFLRYNTYPARIFMGDAGSQLLGFIMGVLVILLTSSSHGPFAPSLSLFLLGLPFLDTIGVTAQRLVEGRSPFIGDRKHIHYKLLRRGFTHYEAVTAIYTVQAGMLGLAYLLRWESDLLIIPLYLIIAGGVLAMFIAAGHRLFPEPVPRSERDRFDTTLKQFFNGPWVTDVPLRFLAVAVPSFLIAMALFPAKVPEDVGSLSRLLFGIALFGIAFLPQFVPYFVRTGLYVGTTFLLYASEGSGLLSAPAFMLTHNILFAVIAVMVLLSLRFNEECRFHLTPLDYLMMFLAVTFPFLPGVGGNVAELGLFVGKLIVLFFSFELLLHAFSDRIRQFGLVSLLIFFGLGIRGWF